MPTAAENSVPALLLITAFIAAPALLTLLILALKAKAQQQKQTPAQTFAQSAPPSPTIAQPGSEMLDTLSDRERELAEWVAEGLTNKEIALRMGLSVNTVQNYLKRVFAKTGVRSRTELALMMHRQQWPE